MPTTKDPENNEVEYLRRFAPLEGSRILDIGCGDGDLTFRYAGLATGVIGVDPDLSRLRTALSIGAEEPSKRVQFAAAHGEALPFPSGYFDLAIFTSSF